jgi:cytochrome b561
MNASKITAVTSYPVSAKVLHWASALIIISMLFLGASMIQTLAPWQYAALALYQSFGVLVLVLVDIRLLNKLRITVPELPSDLSKIQVFAAKGSHVLLYLGMLSLPIWAG